MIAHDSALFYTVLSRIDAERSEAFKLADKEQIFDVVKATIGFNNLNLLVMSCFREWFIDVLEAYVSDGINISALHLRALGNLHRDQGNYARAEAVYNRFNAAAHAEYGSDHCLCVEAQHLLGSVIIHRGNMEAGLGMLESCCAEHEASVEPAVEKEYWTALLALGNAYAEHNRYKKALVTLERFERVAVVNGSSDDKLKLQHLHSKLRRAEVTSKLYPNGRRRLIARPLFEETIAELKEVCGPSHPRTLDANYRFALYLLSLVPSMKPSPDWPWQKSVDGERIVDGEEEAGSQDVELVCDEETGTGRTLRGMDEKAEQLSSNGDDVTLLEEDSEPRGWDDSDVENVTRGQQLLEECAINYGIKLGSHHPETLRVWCSLGDMYREMPGPSLALATEQYKKCLRYRAQTLGARHPDTLLVKYKLAACTDYVLFRLFLYLLAAVSTAALLYVEISILADFRYGVDNYEGWVLTLFLAACAVPMTTVSASDMITEVRHGSYIDLLALTYFRMLLFAGSLVSFALSLMCLRSVIHRSRHEGGLQYLFILYYGYGTIVVLAIEFVVVRGLFVLFRKSVRQTESKRAQRLAKAKVELLESLQPV
jgi:tetratricopeptide (TPR) repeat protein